jgi:hypothetical protein
VPGRHDCRNYSGNEDHRRRGHQAHGVRWTDFEQEASHQPRQADRCGNASRSADHHGQHPTAHHERQHATWRRPQGHANPELRAPPRNGEIEFESIRRLFCRLAELGMNLKWISFDTFQSRDSIQLLRQKGFVTGSQSIDVDSMPYDVTKTALYDGRVAAPAHARAQAELVRLERDPRTSRIDHPANFSKDCADALAGVVFGLSYRREPWVRHGVPMHGTILGIAGRMADRDARSLVASRAGSERHDLPLAVEEG